MTDKKNRQLKKAWQNNYPIYKTNKIEVICSPDYEKNDDIGVFWKDHKETKAFPLTFNIITPIRLIKELSLALLVGLKTLKNDLKIEISDEELNTLIQKYEEKAQIKVEK